MAAKADRPGGRMPRTTTLAACAVALAGCVLCAPTKAQQQPPNPNAPAPAVQNATPDQHPTAPSARNPAPPAVATETPPTAAPSDPQPELHFRAGGDRRADRSRRQPAFDVC